jgi:hypothetical protein
VKAIETRFTLFYLNWMSLMAMIRKTNQFRLMKENLLTVKRVSSTYMETKMRMES